MKSNVRFLGVDDSPATFAQKAVRLVGVVTRGPNYVEGVLSDQVTMDGTDANIVLERMVAGSRFRPMLRAIFLNGASVAGFNIVDLDALFKAVEVPVVSVVRREPDYVAAEAALRKHFPDATTRVSLLARQRPRPFRNGGYSVYCAARGLPDAEIPSVLAAATVKGAIPEPIRLAHIIASGIARGHSRGPA